MTVCGIQEYSYSGRLIEATGCTVDGDTHIATTGSRTRRVIDVPKGFELYMLTKPETIGMIDQIEALGLNPHDYYARDSVHGLSKIRCHQSVVMIKEGERPTYDYELF